MIWYPNDIGMLQGLSDLLFGTLYNNFAKCLLLAHPLIPRSSFNYAHTRSSVQSDFLLL